MKKVNMSEGAVLRRLRQVDQLRYLSISLMKAKPMTEKDAAGLGEKRRRRRLTTTAIADTRPKNEIPNENVNFCKLPRRHRVSVVKSPDLS